MNGECVYDKRVVLFILRFIRMVLLPSLAICLLDSMSYTQHSYILSYIVESCPFGFMDV